MNKRTLFVCIGTILNLVGAKCYGKVVMQPILSDCLNIILYQTIR